MKRSAGLLMYRRLPGGSIEVLLARPGGPYWRGKDTGAWTIPKGEYEPPEQPLDAAVREWAEETGFSYKIMVAYGVLGAIKYLGISVKQRHEDIICRSSALLASALRWCANIYRPALSRPD